ncbi:S1C family serine protease [Alienimonas californiensis]|uniref:Putative periplasmic serine endoprotease DegP-like n=1 Tax=Alienimonas californiensis TaxID=2527989 RepID=A0A517PD60_9PLAN|nr:S1C family serine protease [Alienimonas californiensis]QDT17314.1 putative periplasmic serine endoprotease DegP-like precursor [Alienimonas californiensis]
MILSAVLLALIAVQENPAADAPDAAPAAPSSARSVTADTLPKVVKIFGAGGLRGLPAYGTGFLISPRGHVATAFNHVLDASPNILVVLDDGRRLTCKLLAADPVSGLAVLEPERDDLDLPYFDPAAFAPAEAGDRVLAFSNSYKVAGGDEPVGVQRAVIGAVAELDARRGRNAAGIAGPVLILDAPTNNPGSAGGPVVDRAGLLVGVIGRELKNDATNVFVNYALPAEVIGATLTAMMEGEFVASDVAPPVFSGGPQPADLGALLVADVVRRTPAYVELVEPGSPADAAGLRPGDLIVLLDGELVPSIRLLRARLAAVEPGEPVDVVVRRDGELLPLTIAVPDVEDLREPPAELSRPRR